MIMEQILQILRDPLWQSIGAIFGAIGIGVSVLALAQQRPKKEVTIHVLANSPLFQASAEVRDKLKVYYADRQVMNLNLIQFEMRNTGQVPITPDDYIEPIRIHLAPTSGIVEAGAVESSPINLGMQITSVNDNSIELTKSLINPSDFTVVKIIATDNDGTVRASARIVGVKSIKVTSYAASLSVRTMPPLLRFGLTAVLLTGIGFALFSLVFRLDALVGWMATINMVAFAYIGFDKARAGSTLPRIPEVLLIVLSLAGGSIGVLLGVYIFRHKTQKRSFIMVLWSIIVIQAVLVTMVALRLV